MGVVVTGLGLQSPHGDDPGGMFAALLRGESAVHEVFSGRLARPAAAAEVDFDESRWFTKLKLAGVDRVSQLAVAAAERAVSDAGLLGAIDPTRTGIYAGCGMGGASAIEHAYLDSQNLARIPPLTIPAFMPNAPASQIAIRLGVQGIVLTWSVACASSAIAIGEAMRAVQRGDVDVAIAGGSEALIMPGVVSAWQAMQTLAPFAPGEAAHACRPFAADRGGFVLGEGSAFVVLETEAHARARGARVHARALGYGLSCDATHLTKPDPAGQARALAAALREAGLAPADVGYCNAHGTATRIGDVVESEALATVWGDALPQLRVSSTKALHGHLLGAAGALESVITILALQQRQLPPNQHRGAVDPAIALNLVQPGDTDAPQLQAAVSSSFAFGGTNAVLAFARA
ncbi:MAG: beta-ketoacyl-[acyl-carrier-protein] synthase family protein [Rubrivivax sp.]